jgi:hypothetical protein
VAVARPEPAVWQARLSAKTQGGPRMTDNHMDNDNADREVGRRTLVSVGEAPVVLPEVLTGDLDGL